MAPIHLKRVRIENYLGVKFFDEPFDQNDVTIITGEEGQGKTSVLRAIISAAAGAKYNPDKPVNVASDSDNATIHLECDGYTIDVVLDRNGKEKSCIVRSVDGAKYPSPRTLLDQLGFGGTAFDPVAWIKQGETADGRRKQVQDLLKVIDLGGWSPTVHDMKRKGLYDDRTAENRRLSDLETEYRTLPQIPSDIPDTEISVSDLNVELRKVQSSIEDYRTLEQTVTDARGKVTEAQTMIDNVLTSKMVTAAQELLTDAELSVTLCDNERDRVRSEIERLKVRLEELNGQSNKLIEKKVQAQTDLKSAKEMFVNSWTAEKKKRQLTLEHHEELLANTVKPDTSPIMAKIESAGAVNKAVALKHRSHELVGKIKAQREKSETITAQMAEMDAEKKQKLSALPVPGLSIDDQGSLVFEGIPLDQVNTSKQIEIGVALWMVKKPQFRVLIIQDGNALGKKMRAEIFAIAKANDFQLVMETLWGDPNDCGVVIEMSEGIVKPPKGK